MKAVYKNNFIIMALVLVQSFLGGLSTNFAFALATAAVDVNSKSSAITLTTGMILANYIISLGALIGGVTLGLIVSLVCLFVVP